MPPEEWDEAGKWSSAVQAFLLLAFFFGAVFFGANFRLSPDIEQAQVLIVDLSPPQPDAPPVPEPEPTPPPEPEPVAQTETEAEIALRREEEKRKKEEERKERERKKREEEKRKKEERERKKREEEKRKQEEKERKERERKKREEEEKQRLAEEEAEERRQREAEAEARRSALATLENKYAGYIISSIESQLTEPPELLNAEPEKLEKLEVVVELRLDKNGNLADNLPPLILDPSGIPEYDESVKRAIFKALPLPMPKEPELIPKFRVLTLYIKPK